MSRFSNLEFGSRTQNEAENQAVVKDEAFYLAEAQGALENAEFEQALRAFSKVLEFSPLSVAAWTGQVRMLIELGEFQEARLWSDKALEQFPREPELLAAKAVALARHGELEEALAFSDSAMEARGETAYVWLARGDVLLARREKRADYCFEKALALAPGNWLLCWLSSRVHFFYDKAVLALKFARQALDLDATRSAIWLQLSVCQKALGLSAQARNSLEQAQQLSPQSLAVLQALRNFTLDDGPGLFKRLRRWWQGRAYS